MSANTDNEIAALPSHPCLAALDLGSNSFHMLVARLEQGALQPLLKHKERVQLAAGLDNKSYLSNEAMNRGLDCLHRVQERLQGFEQASVRIVGTHTLRASKNRNLFLQQAEEILGVPVEVISGHEEARLIFQGISHIEPFEGKALVVDIGGGSTELAMGRKYKPKHVASRTMGCVSYSKKFFADGVSSDAFDKAIIAAKQELEVMPHNFVGDNWDSAYATSGTAKALSMALQGCGHEDGILTPRRLRHLAQQLSSGSDNDLLASISPERAKVLPGGLAVMIATMESLQISALNYSDAALREGVLYEMVAQMRHDDIKQRTCKSLELRYAVDKEHAQNVADTCDMLWRACAKAWKLPKPTLALLKHAAHLHEVGLQVNASNLQRHSAYVLANTDLPGFNQEEQILISTLAGNYRKRIQAEEFPQLRSFSNKSVMSLVRLLRLSVLLNIDRKPFDLSSVQVDAAKGVLSLRFTEGLLKSKPLLTADLKREAQYLKKHEMTLNFI